MVVFNLRCLTIFISISFSLCHIREEPICSKFHYEEQLLEKMVRMEHASGLMSEDFKQLTRKVENALETTRSELNGIERQAQKGLEQYKRQALEELEQYKRQVQAGLDQYQQVIQGRSPVPQVAFHVLLKNHVNQQGSGSILKFDTIALNIGGAYDVETGRFTAPFSGIFQFTIVIAAGDKKTAAVNLMKENQVVTYTWVKSDPTWAMTSNTAILDLTSGQQVWLQVGSDSYSYYGGLYSSFSGHLLYRSD